ncbi:hypothetical protein [Neobacillus drentensis]|uniref:hypothetical protein n=1 Tax=Neobacillus drentensis TaxID=220684 RepID=UPI0028665D87|nr:hypothetical protein [Neobacillus drentensis]MDR7235891.1 hypothetical protein [Neobacillus drentensis]
MVTNDEVQQNTDELNKQILNKWLNQELFTFEWFFILFIIVVCYFLFFYLLDKKRIVEILLYGSLVAVAFVVYDSIGLFFGLWADKISLYPVYPNFFGSNLTVAPLIAMIIYQFKSPWDNYLRWSILFSGFFIIGYYGIILTTMEVFVYLKPIAKIIDLSAFLFVLIICRVIMVLILKKEAQKGNISAKHSLSILSAKQNKRNNY